MPLIVTSEHARDPNFIVELGPDDAYLDRLLAAVRTEGVILVMIQRDERGAFWPAAGVGTRPAVVLIGGTLGPKPFHRRSLRRLLSAARFVTVSSGAPHPAAFSIEGNRAPLPGKPSVIVECTPETQDAWLKLAIAAGRLPDEMFLCCPADALPTVVRPVPVRAEA